jgi:hypothetical protein
LRVVRARLARVQRRRERQWRDPEEAVADLRDAFQMVLDEDGVPEQLALRADGHRVKGLGASYRQPNEFWLVPR